VARELSNAAGGLTFPIAADDRFGWSAAGIGDLDQDGVPDFVVGSPGKPGGGGSGGAEATAGKVHVLFMNSDGTAKTHSEIGAAELLPTSPLNAGDRFGGSVASIADLNGDGVSELLVGAPDDDSGGVSCGAVYVLFMATNGSVVGSQKLASSMGGISTAYFSPYDNFGTAVSGIGNQNGIVVGASGTDSFTGAVYILDLDASGFVISTTKLSSSSGLFPFLTLNPGEMFGSSVATLSDGRLVVGASDKDDNGNEASISANKNGGIYLLSFDVNGDVESAQLISNSEGGLAFTIDSRASFGCSMAPAGDRNDDGLEDIIVGAWGYSAGGQTYTGDDAACLVFVSSHLNANAGLHFSRWCLYLVFAQQLNCSRPSAHRIFWSWQLLFGVEF
jgi:hypothetical protein